MDVENTMDIRVELQPDDPVLTDIINISKHDHVSEQEALVRSLKIFYPEVALHMNLCEKNLLKTGLLKKDPLKNVNKGGSK